VVAPRLVVPQADGDVAVADVEGEKHNNFRMQIYELRI
jgi:hypothetical protein